MVGIGGLVAVDMVLALALVSWRRCLGWRRNWLARVRVDMNLGEPSLGEDGPMRMALGWRGTRGRIAVRDGSMARGDESEGGWRCLMSDLEVITGLR